MVYVRAKNIKDGKYYYLVKGEKGENGTRQKVLAYIGTEEELRKLYKNIGKKLENNEK